MKLWHRRDNFFSPYKMFSPLVFFMGNSEIFVACTNNSWIPSVHLCFVQSTRCHWHTWLCISSCLLYCHHVLYRDVITTFRELWVLFFLFQSRWQGSKKPFKYTRGLCFGRVFLNLSLPCDSCNYKFWANHILTKSVILETHMLIF